MCKKLWTEYVDGKQTLSQLASVLTALQTLVDQLRGL